MAHVFFADSGSVSVEVALKLVAPVPGGTRATEATAVPHRARRLPRRHVRRDERVRPRGRDALGLPGRPGPPGLRPAPARGAPVTAPDGDEHWETDRSAFEVWAAEVRALARDTRRRARRRRRRAGAPGRRRHARLPPRLPPRAARGRRRARAAPRRRRDRDRLRPHRPAVRLRVGGRHPGRHVRRQGPDRRIPLSRSGTHDTARSARRSRDPRSGPCCTGPPSWPTRSPARSPTPPSSSSTAAWKEHVPRVGRLLAEHLAPAAALPQVVDVRTLGAVGVVQLDVTGRRRPGHPRSAAARRLGAPVPRPRLHDASLRLHRRGRAAHRRRRSSARWRRCTDERLGRLAGGAVRPPGRSRRGALRPRPAPGRSGATDRATPSTSPRTTTSASHGTSASWRRLTRPSTATARRRPPAASSPARCPCTGTSRPPSAGWPGNRARSPSPPGMPPTSEC